MQGLYEAEFFLLHRIQELRAPFLDWFMERVSFLGNGGWLFIVTGLLLIVPKRTRRVGISVLLSLLCGFLIGNLFLKNAVMRSRPCWLDGTVALLVASPADYSFPSGHTLAAFETAVSVFLYHRPFGIVMLALAACIAFSRMYLFVHFPTDVLCGMLLGAAIAVCVHILVEKHKKYGILDMRKKSHEKHDNQRNAE